MAGLTRFGLVLIWFVVIFCPSSSVAQNAIVPGTIYTDSTIINLGIRWQVTGDANLNAKCSVRYRELGSITWLQGMDLFRTHPNLFGEGNGRPDNRFAGSIFFLQSGTTYQIELTISDIDGGGIVKTVTATTRKEMTPSSTPRDLYVIPGSGSGTGTMVDPYKGLQEAANNALPGDVFHVSAGVYTAFTLTTSGTSTDPIVFKGPVDPVTYSNESEWAIVDGAGTSTGVITIGKYDIVTSNVIIENMVFQNGYWGVDAQNTQDILFKRNVVRDVGYGYYNRRANGWEKNQVISDNVFIGRTPWPGTGIPSERGIDLRGTGNIVRYNRVQYFGDGVSVQPMTGNAYANDIYGNDIAYIVDDPIEIDYNNANTRVWRNRVLNGRMGVSLAPIYGGPVYIFRNEFFNTDYSTYKMNREPAGLVIIHNTAAKLQNGTSSPAGWQNTYFRNNILLGTRYVFEEYGLVAGSVDDWDYDALGTTGSPFAKWNNVRYANLNDLKLNSGIEANAVPAAMGDLVNCAPPSTYADGIMPGTYDLRLKPGVAAINAGQYLPNINDPYVTDGKPDCGAYEYGAPLPSYGPRAPVVTPLRVFKVIICLYTLLFIVLFLKSIPQFHQG